MRRLAILITVAILGIALLAAADAQQSVAPPTVRPPPTTTPQGSRVTAPSNLPVLPTYAELRQQNQTLSQQLAAASQQLAVAREQTATLQQQNRTLRSQVGQMTSLGGSLVRAHCASPTLSRNTAGVQASCERYLCEPVSGQCRDRCSVTAHCAPGYYCDNTVCIPP